MANEMGTEQTSLRNLWPRRVSWPTVVFAFLAIASLIAVSNPRYRYAMQTGTSGSGGMPPMAVDTSISNTPEGEIMDLKVRYPYPYPYQNPDVPVSDTREFLKTYYSATLSTRDVQGLTRRVETTVRGYDGRIDQESSSPQYGSVSFAIPQGKYEAFRTELESLVGSRFIVTSISSQNLLPQKVSIEEQQKQADTALAEYRVARQKIVTAHANAVRSLQAMIDAARAELTVLGAQTPTSETAARLQIVASDMSSLQQRLTNENAAYTSQLNTADKNITSAIDWQKAVGTKDQALMDEVATVNGTVSIQWISLWDMAQRYLPGYWISSIFAALAFLSLLRDRRRFGTL